MKERRGRRGRDVTTYLAGILRRDWWDRLLSLLGDLWVLASDAIPLAEGVGAWWVVD